MLNVMQYVKRLRPIDDVLFEKLAEDISVCEEVTDETSQRLENGLTEIYVNTKVNDGSEISELMSCFLQENVENDKFPCLSRRVSYLKNSEEVVKNF